MDEEKLDRNIVEQIKGISDEKLHQLSSSVFNRLNYAAKLIGGEIEKRFHREYMRRAEEARKRSNRFEWGPGEIIVTDENGDVVDI